ncbi:carboxymuconolactone decarboxylase family protein [Streptomyces capparidis]
MNWYKTVPDVYRALHDLNKVAHQGVDPVLAELVKLRASQLNGCAFCLDMHSKDARAAGETEQRIHLLSAWREAPHLYSERERAALALTEQVTELGRGGVSDEVWREAAEAFPAEELARLIGLIVVINGWNRINVATRHPAGDYVPGSLA